MSLYACSSNQYILHELAQALDHIKRIYSYADMERKKYLQLNLKEKNDLLKGLAKEILIDLQHTPELYIGLDGKIKYLKDKNKVIVDNGANKIFIITLNDN